MELTILMPCLDEAETLSVCIEKAKKFLARSGVSGEVLIADNGSTDGSVEIAASHGVRVVPVAERGYGAALAAGIDAARGIFVIMGDADDSYDFSALDNMVAALRQGSDLVMGNRFRGGILPGAMPPLHRYLGNPVLSFIGRLLFRSPVRDFHCGLRGFRRDAILALDLCTSGMEFASEMVVKATLSGLRIAEVPIVLHPDGRSRPPHLRSWRDGWRHLRFLLLFSPKWLFLYPGLALFLVGSVAELALFLGPLHIGRITLDIHTMLFMAIGAIVGVQMVWFAIFSRIIGQQKGILPRNTSLDGFVGRLTLERGIVAGILLVIVGLAMALAAVGQWGAVGFGQLNPAASMRYGILSLTATVMGAELVIASFFLGVIALPARRKVA